MCNDQNLPEPVEQPEEPEYSITMDEEGWLVDEMGREWDMRP